MPLFDRFRDQWLNFSLFFHPTPSFFFVINIASPLPTTQSSSFPDSADGDGDAGRNGVTEAQSYARSLLKPTCFFGEDLPVR